MMKCPDIKSFYNLFKNIDNGSINKLYTLCEIIKNEKCIGVNEYSCATLTETLLKDMKPYMIITVCTWNT